MTRLKACSCLVVMAALAIGMSPRTSEADETDCCWYWPGTCDHCCFRWSSECCSDVGGEAVDDCVNDCMSPCRPAPPGSKATLTDTIEGPPAEPLADDAGASSVDRPAVCSEATRNEASMNQVACCFLWPREPCKRCCETMSATCCSLLGGVAKDACNGGSGTECPTSCRPVPGQSVGDEPVTWSETGKPLADVEPGDKVISSPADPLPKDPDCEEEDLTAVPTETSDAKRQ